MHGDRRMKDISQVFAFFGADLRHDDAALGHEGGRRLLALDAAAIGAAHSAGRPFTVLDDWVAPSEIAEARRIAQACGSQWYAGARDAFSSAGVCWPEIDSAAMLYFWEEALLAERLAKALLVAGVSALHYCRRDERRAMLHDEPSDVCGAIWEHLLPGVVQPLSMRAGEMPAAAPGHSRGASVLRMGLRRWERRTSALFRRLGLKRTRHRSPAPEAAPAAVLEGRIVWALNHHEAYRFGPIAQRIAGRWPDQVAAVICHGEPVRAVEIAEHWGVHAHCAMPAAAEPERLSDQLLAALEATFTLAADADWGRALRAVPFHFEWYCRERWPQLAASLESWLDLFRRARPRALIVSTLQDAESQLPAIAAARLAIPTVAVPHGAMEYGHLHRASSDFVFCGSELQRRANEAAGIEPPRLLRCRGVVAEQEYPHVAAAPDSREKPWHVLALTGPIGAAGIMGGFTCPRAQIEGVRALCTPPDDIAARFTLRIKPHPHKADLGLLEAAGVDIAETVVEPQSDLHALLPEAGLVVGVNYQGSALLHAAKAGKPMVFFWMDEAMGVDDARPHDRLWLPAAKLVREPAVLWDTIRRFFTDAAFADEMRNAVSAFASEQIDDAGFPDVVETLAGLTGFAAAPE